MKIILSFVLVVLALGCADTLEDPNQGTENGFRALPKTYVAPTPETLLDTEEWQHVGPLEIGGNTQMGTAAGLVAFDARLGAGQEVVVHNFSGGWTSVHVFGARPSTDRWETIESVAQSQPLDAQVEGGQIEFAAPFSGHYLFMLEPIIEEEVDYLMRLDCSEEC